MLVSAIVTAAGLGKRMGKDMPKQFLEIGGKPILWHTLNKFEASKKIGFLVIVTEPNFVNDTKELVARMNLTKEWCVIAGGKERQDSVHNGLQAIPSNTDIVIVHDGVRPFIETSLIDESIDIAAKSGACLVAAPIKETIKLAGDKGSVLKTVDRRNLWGAQTPQTFRYDILKAAFEKAYQDNFYGTDDASLVERIGKSVKLLSGTYQNIKITTPDDLVMAEALASTNKTMRSKMRTGIGYDVHRLVEDRKLILGGVTIEHNKGLLGHSDADVLLHAIMDAMLGAAALGDIGKHFPDTDPTYKGADSRDLLKATAKLLHKKGFCIENIDATIIAQKPKMAPHIEKMRKNIAADLETSIDSISIKATTNEEIGFIGRGEGIAAQAIAQLRSS